MSVMGEAREGDLKVLEVLYARQRGNLLFGGLRLSARAEDDFRAVTRDHFEAHCVFPSVYAQ